MRPRRLLNQSKEIACGTENRLSMENYEDNGRRGPCRTQTGDVVADSKGYRLTEGDLRDPPTSESAEVNCHLLSGFHLGV